MTVFEIAISEGVLNLESAVVTEKLITCSDINIVAGECYATQAAISAATFEVDLGRVPVDVLFNFLFLEINSEYAAVAFTLMAAPHNRSRD